MRTLPLNIVHLVPFDPRSIWWTDQLDAANQVLGSNSIEPIQAVVDSISALEFGDGDGVISVGFCAPPLEEEHQALFDAVSPWPGGVVVYIIDGFEDAGWSGCAAHPPAKPGLLLPTGSRNSPRWVLAHELGHLLDLGDRSDSTLFMFGSIWWTQDPPAWHPADEPVALRSPILI